MGNDFFGNHPMPGSVFDFNSKACMDTIGSVISLMEASVTLYVLQETVRILTDVERIGSWVADDIDGVLGVLNAGSRNERIALPATYWYYSEMSNLNTELSSRGEPHSGYMQSDSRLHRR